MMGSLHLLKVFRPSSQLWIDSLICNDNSPPTHTHTIDFIDKEDIFPFTVGTSASIRCHAEPPITMIQWLDPSLKVVNKTKEESLNLFLYSVNHNHNNSVYTCRVTGEDGVVREQKISLTVKGVPVFQYIHRKD